MPHHTGLGGKGMGQQTESQGAAPKGAAPVDVLARVSPEQAAELAPKEFSWDEAGAWMVGYNACADQHREAVTELVDAASHRVAHSFEQARDMDDRAERPIWCEVDVLNPCWFPGRPITVPLQHWGGGDACPECRLRAALAPFQTGGAE